MESPQLAGVCDALCQCTLDGEILAMLKRLVTNESSAGVVNAAFVLSFHGECNHNVDEYLADENPALRKQAWRVKTMNS